MWESGLSSFRIYLRLFMSVLFAVLLLYLRSCINYKLFQGDKVDIL